MARSAPHPDSFNHITDAAPEYVDVILWHRVVLAVAALALVVAGLGYGAFRLSGTDDESTPPLTSVALDELTQQEAPAAIPEPDIIPKPAAIDEQPAAAVEPAAASAITPSQQIAVTPTETVETRATTPTPALREQAASSARADKNRYKVNTTILVPAVKRAVLTDSMRGREPGPALTDTRSLGDQPTFSLYQFVDIRGKAGDTLIYHWKRNGKTVAKVRIPVGSDKWRNHASKNFNQNLMGDWQVDVTNQNNMLLVRSEFRLGE